MSQFLADLLVGGFYIVAFVMVVVLVMVILDKNPWRRA